MSASFPKSERLAGHKDIAQLFSEGNSLFSHPFKLIYRLNPESDCSRFMISVPKKNFKRAVDRNLLKRRTRESYRLHKHLIGSNNYDLAFIYIAKDILSYSKVDEKLLALLHRLS